MIRLEGVTKLYKTVIGVNDINLDLPPGTYGLLGPNGSGKTTLINLILGQLKPTIGSVRLFDTNPWKRSKLLSRVGLCPAMEVTYPRITGLEWVTYMTELHGFQRADARRRAISVLEQVNLSHAMERPMRSYSLGMRQRAKIAQSMAHDPELLILDEPFSGLDPIGRREMIDLLKTWAGNGRSLILASHILHEVEAIRPSFLLISGGRLLASGTPEEVRTILANSPFKLRFRSKQAKQLSAELLTHCDIESIIFEDAHTFTVATQRAAQVYALLPELSVNQGIEIDEVSSSDDSLKSLFSTLMRIHRGEMNQGVGS